MDLPKNCGYPDKGCIISHGGPRCRSQDEFISGNIKVRLSNYCSSKVFQPVRLDTPWHWFQSDSSLEKGDLSEGAHAFPGNGRAFKVLFFSFCKYFMRRDITTVGMPGAFPPVSTSRETTGVICG